MRGSQVCKIRFGRVPSRSTVKQDWRNEDLQGTKPNLDIDRTIEQLILVPPESTPSSLDAPVRVVRGSAIPANPSAQDLKALLWGGI